ncbi:glycosyl transferase group 1 [Thermotomaculum hydrothermale]|uniref:Glycosyl transferase group 1 n=1 Tax=Thermotomaculum hydrothermale TaxID=981385 RepID=A0A7R6PGP2_9BACT|nr:glycosyl transferase group 1 [Thermotomaculum hydrothermale]
MFKIPGGDTNQIVETAKFLKEYGVDVDISTELKPDLKGYDLVHLYNLTSVPDVYIQALNARKQGKPVIITPIYINWREVERFGSYGIRRILANILPYSAFQELKIGVKAIKNREFNKKLLLLFIKGYIGLIKKTLNLADFIVPNSHMEMDAIKKDLKISKIPYSIVYNGIDTEVFDYEKTKIDNDIAVKLKDSIISVSRVAMMKNQINLVKAVNGLPFKLFIIGSSSPNQRFYYEKLKKIAGENVFFLGFVDRNELPQYFKAAKVHVLPSWFETTGLVSLEAAAMKCNVVITKKGYQYEYFKDYAFYCEPDDVNSIRNAILKAFNSPFNEEFCNFVVNNYSRKENTLKLLKIYENFIEREKESGR